MPAVTVRLYRFRTRKYGKPKGACFALCEAHRASQKVPEGMRLWAEPGDDLGAAYRCSECPKGPAGS